VDHLQAPEQQCDVFQPEQNYVARVARVAIWHIANYKL
jgi:hypothetical protein